MDERVLMRIIGTMAKLLVRVDPMYAKYIVMERNQEVIYVELEHALYGTLQTAFLFWKDLTKNLEEWGFERNPYDWCVANKMINGFQCTVVWHVDDIKISHVDPLVIETILEQLNGRYGKEAPLVVMRGPVHEYLDMTLDFGSAGVVWVIMKDYIENMLVEVPGNMNGTAVTPVGIHLFEVVENCEKLDAATAQLFHHYTAKLLFLAKRGRPDVLLLWHT